MDNEKHYNTLSRYYKYRYEEKIAKVSLNTNFGCPNRDGKVSYGGCTFCSDIGSGDFAGNIQDNLQKQFSDIKKIMRKKWPSCKFIPYFQAYSNTYADIDTLRKVYQEAMNLDEQVVSLAIATRPDCIDEDIALLLGEMNQIKPIQIELGLQTIHEKTAKKINRGYTLEIFEQAIDLLQQYNLEIVVHIINGLPHETKQDMIETIKYLNKFPLQGIKIHSLLLLKHTKMALEYYLEPFPILTLPEYVDIVCDQIGYLRDDIIIHRIAADGKSKDVIAPEWTSKKLVVANEIDKELRKRNLYQGDYLKFSSNNECL